MENENKKSFLKLSSVKIPSSKLSIRIPTVGEILDNERYYYSLISSLTATPFQYMVQLDDMGIDFTTVTDYQLFMMLFSSFSKGDMSILFGDIDLSDTALYKNNQNDTLVLYSSKNDIIIDELVYHQIVDVIRKINCLKRENRTVGNKDAQKLRLKIERKKQKQHSNKPYEPYLEKLVTALVNRAEFKYNYEQVNHLTIYQFNQSFEQIKTSINFDNTMIGVYAGTVDTSKLKDKSCLSWIPIE